MFEVPTQIRPCESSQTAVQLSVFGNPGCFRMSSHFGFISCPLRR